jgi:hypothetical protein
LESPERAPAAAEAAPGAADFINEFSTLNPLTGNLGAPISFRGVKGQQALRPGPARNDERAISISLLKEDVS